MIHIILFFKALILKILNGDANTEEKSSNTLKEKKELSKETNKIDEEKNKKEESEQKQNQDKEPKKYDSKQRKKTKKERKRRKRKALIIDIILISSIFFASTFLPKTIALIGGEEVQLTAIMSKKGPLEYEIRYDFENDLNNLYLDAEIGDIVSLESLLWNGDLKSDVEILYINRDEGYFITSLPRVFDISDTAFMTYRSLKYPKYVILTLKVSNFGSIISDVSPNLNFK